MNAVSSVARRRIGHFVFVGIFLFAAAAAFCGRNLLSATPSDDTPSSLPKYGSQAVRLFHARDYLRTHEAPDFWAMMPYYIHQFNESACSVASTAMVVNAARAQAELSTTDELVTQGMLLRHVAYPRWHDAILEGDDGVKIEDFGGYLREALERFAPDRYEVEAVRVKTDDAGLRERVRKMLLENERSDDDFVIVVFWQATFTDDPDGEMGHIAPLAAYDAENERALIFDPDRDWYEPYWVPLDTLVAGMARPDPETGRARGYLWVRKVHQHREPARRPANLRQAPERDG